MVIFENGTITLFPCFTLHLKQSLVFTVCVLDLGVVDLKQ